MEEKINNYKSKALDHLYQLRDVRIAGLVLFTIIVLAMSWSGVKAIETNYGLQKQISRLQQENEVHTLSNNNLKLQNQYLNTDTYLELQARKSLGLAAPGERVIIVPRDVALAHYKQPTADKIKEAQTARAKQPTYQRNFQAWMDFFLHRDSLADE